MTCAACLGHRRHQRHRGGARCRSRPRACRCSRGSPATSADARCLPLNRSMPGEARRVAAVVVVVAAAHLQEIAGQGQRLAVGPGHLDGPARIRRRPRGPAHAMAEADLLVDAVCGGGLVEVAQDRRPVGDRPSRRARAGSDSRACACRNRSGSPGSGTDPRCPRWRRAPRGWRSSCWGSRAAGDRPTPMPERPAPTTSTS